MKNKIKVLQVIASTSIGGAPEIVRLIAAHIDGEAFQMEVATANDGPYFESIRQLDLDMHLVKIWGLNRLNPRPAFELRKLFKNGCYDVIHLHGTRTGFWGAIAARGAGIPIIYTEHILSFIAGHNYLTGKLFENVERYIGRNVQRLVTVSSGDAVIANRYKLAPKKNVVVVKNGIELNRFRCENSSSQTLRYELGIPPGYKVVGCIGRLHRQKDPHGFFEIAKAVVAEQPHTCFLWVGGGELHNEIESLVQKNNIPNVIFTGFRDDIPALLGVMDIFLATSRWESFHLTVLEAMTVGLPIVATNISGTCELVRENENGFLFTPFNVNEAADYVLQLLNDEQLRNKFGQAGPRIAHREYSVDKMVAGYERLYRELAQQSQNE